MINFLNSVAFCTHKSTPFSIIAHDVEDSNEALFYSVANQVVELNQHRGCKYNLHKENLTFEFKYKHTSELGVESNMSIEFRFKIRNKERLEHLYASLPIFCKIMREKTIQDYAIKLSKTHFPVANDVETTIHDELNGLYFGPLPQCSLHFKNTIGNLTCFMFDVAAIRFNTESDTENTVLFSEPKK